MAKIKSECILFPLNYRQETLVLLFVCFDFVFLRGSVLLTNWNLRCVAPELNVNIDPTLNTSNKKKIDKSLSEDFILVIFHHLYGTSLYWLPTFIHWLEILVSSSELLKKIHELTVTSVQSELMATKRTERKKVKQTSKTQVTYLIIHNAVGLVHNYG